MDADRNTSVSGCGAERFLRPLHPVSQSTAPGETDERPHRRDRQEKAGTTGKTRRTGRYCDRFDRLGRVRLGCGQGDDTQGMPSLNAVTPKVEFRALAPVAVSLAAVP